MVVSFPAVVRLNGRVTVPLSIRNELGIEEGDLVQLTVRKVRPEEKAVESSGEGNFEALATT